MEQEDTVIASPDADPPQSESPIPAADLAELSLDQSSPRSRLNARAPEFVPRTEERRHHQKHKKQHQNQYQRLMPVRHPLPVPVPAQMIHVYHPHHGIVYPAPPPPPPPHPAAPVVSGRGSYECYGGGGSGFVEKEHGAFEVENGGNAGGTDELPEEVVHKVTKQVEYYFSDANLATTELLMKFISKDPEGFVPISVIAPFKKIRALVNNPSQLAATLRTSSKLVVSDDGKRVKRQQPITGAYLEELQSRIVVAENLPEDHCYQNLVKIFSLVGSVKTIRTCYPQPNNNSPNARPGKLEGFLLNKLHAFVEYEKVEQAEKAVMELNDERNWRSGLRVRFLPKNMMHGQGPGTKTMQDGDGNADGDNLILQNQTSTEMHPEDYPDSTKGPIEYPKDRDYPRIRKGRGRDKGRSRGTPNNLIPVEYISTNKQPPGPRMPDGTRGFAMGRGKPIVPISSDP